MSQPSGDTEGTDREQVGSVSEEARKLFGALSDWARDQGPDVAHGVAGLVEHATEATREAGDHPAAGDCAFCPVCRTVHAVRRTSPEVRAHLAVAAGSLLQAAAAMLATAVPPEARAQRPRDGGVEHIELDPETGSEPSTETNTDGVWSEEDDA